MTLPKLSHLRIDLVQRWNRHVATFPLSPDSTRFLTYLDLSGSVSITLMLSRVLPGITTLLMPDASIDEKFLVPEPPKYLRRCRFWSLALQGFTCAIEALDDKDDAKETLNSPMLLRRWTKWTQLNCISVTTDRIDSGSPLKLLSPSITAIDKVICVHPDLPLADLPRPLKTVPTDLKVAFDLVLALVDYRNGREDSTILPPGLTSLGRSRLELPQPFLYDPAIGIASKAPSTFAFPKSLLEHMHEYLLQKGLDLDVSKCQLRQHGDELYFNDRFASLLPPSLIKLALVQSSHLLDANCFPPAITSLSLPDGYHQGLLQLLHQFKTITRLLFVPNLMFDNLGFECVPPNVTHLIVYENIEFQEEIRAVTSSDIALLSKLPLEHLEISIYVAFSNDELAKLPKSLKKCRLNGAWRTLPAES